MNCYAGVVDNPFYAVSDDKGNFTIKGVPNGTYTLEVWHEKYGTQNMSVTVNDKETTARGMIWLFKNSCNGFQNRITLEMSIAYRG